MLESVYIPEEDARVINEEFSADYREHPQLFLDLSGMIARRLYIEWCLDSDPKKLPNSRDVFLKFIEMETHYQMERIWGFNFNEETKCFEGDDYDDEIYSETRETVVRAVARRARDLFSDWGARNCPPALNGEVGDKRNLREKDGLIKYLPL